MSSFVRVDGFDESSSHYFQRNHTGIEKVLLRIILQKKVNAFVQKSVIL